MTQHRWQPSLDRVDDLSRGQRAWTFDKTSRIIGAGVIVGVLATLVLLATTGIAVLLSAMVGATVFENALLLLITFGLTATMVGKFSGLF